MIEKKVLVQNIEISYKTNNRTPPTIMFLHGNSLSSETFRYQYQAGTLDELNLLAIDFPGHGDSQWSKNPEKEYSLFGLRDIILELIKKLKIGKFLFAGHSLGGHVAIECLPYLKNCNGIMLWGTPPVKLPLDISEVFLPNPEISLFYKSNLSDDERASLVKQLVQDKHHDLINNIIKKSDPQFRASLSQSLTEGKVSDEKKILQNSNINLALLHGSNDPIIKADYLHKLSELRLWKNNVQVIPNAGHSAQLDNYKAFNSLLLNFTNVCFTLKKEF